MEVESPVSPSPELSKEKRAVLHEIYSRHGRVGQDGTSELNFQEFCKLAQSLQIAWATEEEQKKVFADFAKRSGCGDTMSFEDLCAWAAESPEAQAALELWLQQDVASLSAGIARAALAFLRPAGGMALLKMLLAMKAKVLLVVKKATFFAKAKAALSLEAYMKNPFKLFRRQVISPWDPFRQSNGGVSSTIDAVRQEVREKGLKGLSDKSIAPYMTNAVIAMVMFHTYTTTRLALHGFATTHPALADMPLCCEAIAGASAGIVQATLHSPLYNVRLCRDEEIALNRDHKGLWQRLRELHQRSGVRGCFQNYSFITAQEALALMSFFTSYEWLKLKTTAWARQIDHSGEKDIWGWAVAACGSGVILSAVGTPFENLLAWHVAERRASQPNGVWKHFLHEPSTWACRRSILFGGMRSKLLVAPLAGLPLLAYEVMVHQGMAPRFHP